MPFRPAERKTAKGVLSSLFSLSLPEHFKNFGYVSEVIAFIGNQSEPLRLRDRGFVIFAAYFRNR